MDLGPKVFDLSFRCAAETQFGVPCIDFLVAPRHFPMVLAHWQVLGMRDTAVATERYFSAPTDFQPLNQDRTLFGEQVVGYGGVAVVREEDGVVRISLPLATTTHARLLSRTLMTLLIALARTSYEPSIASNETAERTFTVRAEHRAEGYGHAVHGYIGTSFLNYLQAYADGEGRKALPESVVAAIRAGWGGSGMEEYDLPYFTAEVRADGAFSLQCPGDACDLSVYDTLWHEDTYASFSCHNLDTPRQQLALVAGLAMLSRLVREAKP